MSHGTLKSRKVMIEKVQVSTTLSPKKQMCFAVVSWTSGSNVITTEVKKKTL